MSLHALASNLWWHRVEIRCLSRGGCAGSIIDGMNKSLHVAAYILLYLSLFVSSVVLTFEYGLGWGLLLLCAGTTGLVIAHKVADGLHERRAQRFEDGLRRATSLDHDAHWHAEQLRWWLRLERKRDSFRTMSGALLGYLRIEVHWQGEMLRENVEWMHDQFRDRMDKSERLPMSEKDVETLLHGLVPDDQVSELGSAVWGRWEAHCMGRAGG